MIRIEIVLFLLGFPYSPFPFAFALLSPYLKKLETRKLE